MEHHVTKPHQGAKGRFVEVRFPTESCSAEPSFALENRLREFSIGIEPRWADAAVKSGETRLPELRYSAENYSSEPGFAAKGHPIEPGLIVEGRSIESDIAAEFRGTESSKPYERSLLEGSSVIERCLTECDLFFKSCLYEGRVVIKGRLKESSVSVKSYPLKPGTAIECRIVEPVLVAIKYWLIETSGTAKIRIVEPGVSGEGRLTKVSAAAKRYPQLGSLTATLRWRHQGHRSGFSTSARRWPAWPVPTGTSQPKTSNPPCALGRRHSKPWHSRGAAGWPRGAPEEPNRGGLIPRLRPGDQVAGPL